MNDVYRLISFIFSIINVIFIYKVELVKKIKEKLFNVFWVEKVGFIAHIAMCFYIFSITSLLIFNILLLNFKDLLQIFFPLLGFPLIYRIVLKITPF